jgi:predicted nucleotide-binding protein
LVWFVARNARERTFSGEKRTLMSTDKPFDPFSWLPPKRPQPSISDLLSNNPYTPPSNPSPELLKQIESALKQPQTPSPPALQKSLADKLKDHVAFGNKLLNENKLTKSTAAGWVARLRILLQPMFLNGSPFMKQLDALRKQWATTVPTKEELSEKIRLAFDIADFLEQTAGVPSGYPRSRSSRAPATKNVFIIHGKDELNARRLADSLREEGANPIVMMAQPGLSRALTDKFEDEASKCSFAFALFTTDDLVSSDTEQYGQARPNVIYETGWFIGRLGKTRAILLLQTGAEMHTDLQGVSRIHFQNDVREKFQEIRRELKAIGLV